jgi:acyl carrier protein
MSIESQVRQLIATTLKLPLEKVMPSASTQSVAAWDSLGQVNVVMALEQTFAIYVEPEDFALLDSVHAITDYLKANGVA